VGVRSQPGRGSVFHVVLNTVHGTDVAHRNGVTLEGSGDGLQVLVIEGDKVARARLQGSLSASGFRVHSTHSAQQALQNTGRLRYDALTLGLQPLAAQGGLDLLASIRSEGRSQHAPVVGMTMAAGVGGPLSFAIENILAKPLRGNEVAAALAGYAGPQPGSATVLVIDDDPLALEVMRSTLQAIGLTAVCHLDGRQALLQIDAVRPCAIVLDLMMPGFDGFAVLDALQALPAWRATPVFIWTSMLLSDAEYATLARSAQDIVSKGGGALAVMLERLRSWRPPVALTAPETSASKP
jgi:CheY-like chemotaxis protein